MFRPCSDTVSVLAAFVHHHHRGRGLQEGLPCIELVMFILCACVVPARATSVLCRPLSSREGVSASERLLFSLRAECSWLMPTTSVFHTRDTTAVLWQPPTPPLIKTPSTFETFGSSSLAS